MIPNHYKKMGGFTKHPLKHSCFGYQVDVSLAFLPSCLLYSFQWTWGHVGHESLLENFQAVKSKQPFFLKKWSSLELSPSFFCWSGTSGKCPRADERLLTRFFLRRARTVLLKGIFYGKVVNAWEADSSTLAAPLRFRWKKMLRKKRWGEIWRNLFSSGKSLENGVLFEFGFILQSLKK